MTEKKKRKTPQEILNQKKSLRNIENRFLEMNVEARSFCFSHNFTVYPAVQKDGRLRLFKQHHEHFLPIDAKTYSQYERSEQMEMCAVMDETYESFYNKHKARGKGKFMQIQNRAIENSQE